MSNSWTLRKFDLAADSMAVLSEHTGPAAARRALADLVASGVPQAWAFFQRHCALGFAFHRVEAPAPSPGAMALASPPSVRAKSASPPPSGNDRSGRIWSRTTPPTTRGRARLAPDFASDKPFGDLVGVSVRDAWELHPLPHSDAEEEAAIEAAYRRLGAQDKSLVDRLGGPAACGMRVVYLMGWFEPLMGHPRAEYVRERMRRAVSELTA